MYCRNCGHPIDASANVCPYCGAPQHKADANDSGSPLWGLLGCCIPIAGLILFLVWKDTKPRTAKAAGIGALVAFILGILYYVVAFTLGFGLYAFG